MAKNKALEKVLKDAKKRQKAFGRAWAEPFPRDILKQQQKSADSKVVKIRAQPTKYFMKSEELLDAVRKEAELKPALPGSSIKTSSTAPKPAATVKPASKSRKDSLSPLPSAPKPKRTLVRQDSGISLKSSSSVTSVKGVHLHLATVSPEQLGSWTSDWEKLTLSSKDHLDAYFSTIETTTVPAGLRVYADCDNKLMANLLKGKLAGEEVLGRKLICNII